MTLPELDSSKTIESDVFYKNAFVNACAEG